MDEKAVPHQQPLETLSDSDIGHVLLSIDKDAERSYVRKLDFYLLPFLSLCYFFSAVDRVSRYRYPNTKPKPISSLCNYALVTDEATEQHRQC